VLDPEQNNTFRDHYLGVPYDLSKVLFIATANQLEPIQPAFLDRMEVIPLSGYTEEEKIIIAKRHIIPKQVKENGLKESQIEFVDKGIAGVISQYTREAGLRNLERELATICRKVARKVAEDDLKETAQVDAKSLDKFLGATRILPEESLKTDRVGVATGLAWTPSGGDILFIEATTMKGKGDLMLTGQLGDVMKESARAALSYARARSAELGVPDRFFAMHDIHVHVPEGAIPKDGPSAGITMAVAMISAVTGRPVRHDIAMTGEITLRGQVLPIGGVKEKVLAARRAGIKKIILPALCRRSLEDVPDYLRKEMEFFFVDEVSEVFHMSLIEERRKGRRAVAVMQASEAT